MKEIKITLSDKLITRLKTGLTIQRMSMQGAKLSDDFIAKILSLLEEDVAQHTFKLSEESKVEK